MIDWRIYYDDPVSILQENEAKVIIDDELDNGVKVSPTWYLTWKHGAIYLGQCDYLTKRWAEVQAALFIRLWVPLQNAAEADDISCGYVRGHTWFEQRQHVYQLRAICFDGEVDFSRRVWYTRELAEKARDGFLQTCIQKRMNVKTIDVLPLELGPWSENAD